MSEEILSSRIRVDEFSRGYRGRLQWLNIFKTTTKFMAALGAEVHPKGTQLSEFSEPAILTLAARIPLQEFVQSHSLLPLFRMASSSDGLVIHGDPARPDVISLYGTRLWARIGARFCIECIEEDIETSRCAYWHRSHQLPGICWCSKHGGQLAISTLKDKAFDVIPHPEMEAEYEFSDQDFAAIAANVAIKRYADIIFSILDAARPTLSLHAIYRMSELLKKHQIRVSEYGQRPTLADRLLDQMPSAWLQSLYPTIDRRNPCEYFNSIDSVASRPVANHVYALALSSLFDSSNDAIGYWFSNTDGLPQVRKHHRPHRPHRSYGKGYWSSDEVCKLYMRLRGNHTKIAEALGVERTFASRQLKAAGLPSLQRSDSKP